MEAALWAMKEQATPQNVVVSDPLQYPRHASALRG